MIVAQVFVATGRFRYEQRHAVGFASLEKAKSEYDRLADILTRRNDRKNDLPKTVDIDGDAGNRITVGVDDISTLGLIDFAFANEQEAGVKDAFPHLFKK